MTAIHGMNRPSMSEPDFTSSYTRNEQQPHGNPAPGMMPVPVGKGCMLPGDPAGEDDSSAGEAGPASIHFRKGMMR